jgi:hypothetical protein
VIDIGNGAVQTITLSGDITSSSFIGSSVLGQELLL